MLTTVTTFRFGINICDTGHPPVSPKDSWTHTHTHTHTHTQSHKITPTSAHNHTQAHPHPHTHPHTTYYMSHLVTQLASYITRHPHTHRHMHPRSTPRPTYTPSILITTAHPYIHTHPYMHTHPRACSRRRIQSDLQPSQVPAAHYSALAWRRHAGRTTTLTSPAPPFNTHPHRRSYPAPSLTLRHVALTNMNQTTVDRPA